MARRASYKRNNKRRQRSPWRWNVLLLVMIIAVCAAIVFEVGDFPLEGEEAETVSIFETITDSLSSDSEGDASEADGEEVDLSDIDSVLSEQGLIVMFDGTVFDPAWYQEELSAAGDTELDDAQTTAEIYRHYQLYGQGDGLTAYDTSGMDETTIAELAAYEEQLKAQYEEENGAGWITVTSDIHDTEEVTVWNSEYTLSQEAEDALAEVLALFENDGYDVGFVVLDLSDGSAVSYNAGIEVYSASVIKAPYIFSLLEAGYEPTEDMYLAGNQSDNDAYVSLRETYGNDVFAEWIEDTGIPEEQSATKYITTTPLDLARMFFKGQDLLLGDETYSDWARDTFTDSLNSAAALTIGETKSVYSKAGWISQSDGYSVSSYTNAAIVDGDNPYVIAFMADTPGWTGLTYAQVLMPVLDMIHDEMCGLTVDYSTLDLTGEESDTSEGSEGIDDSRMWSDGAPDPGAEGGPNWAGDAGASEEGADAAAGSGDAAAADGNASAGSGDAAGADPALSGDTAVPEGYADPAAGTDASADAGAAAGSGGVTDPGVAGSGLASEMEAGGP